MLWNSAEFTKDKRAEQFGKAQNKLGYDPNETYDIMTTQCDL